jgi:hypothetical protein
LKKYKIVKYRKVSTWSISKTSFTAKKRLNAVWFYAIKERKWYGWAYILENDLEYANVKVFPSYMDAKNELIKLYEQETGKT